MRDPWLGRIDLVADLVEVSGFGGHLDADLLARGSDDLAEALERRAGGHAALVHGRGEHEGGEGERDAGRGDAEAEAPADVLLDPDEEHAGDDGAEAHAEIGAGKWGVSPRSNLDREGARELGFQGWLAGI